VRLGLLALLFVSLLLAAGCSGGVSEGTNLDRGRELFLNGDGDAGERSPAPNPGVHRVGSPTARRGRVEG